MAARPDLCLDVHPRHADGGQAVAFPADQHRRLGPLTAVWDRVPIHGEAGAVRARRAEPPGVGTEKAPGYAPGLNPDEGAWGRATRGRLASPAAGDAGGYGTG